MSVILEDAVGQTLHANAWNWGVLHRAISQSASPLCDDSGWLDHLRAGCGLMLSAPEIDALHHILSAEVLPQLSPGQRLLADLSLSDEADEGTFYRDDLSRNYSLEHEVLLAIIQFLQNAQAPVEVW